LTPTYKKVIIIIIISVIIVYFAIRQVKYAVLAGDARQPKLL